MTYALSPDLQQDCLDMLEDYYRLVLTVDQLEAVLAKNVSFRKNLIRYNSPRDTGDREVLGYLVIKEILGLETGRGWPTYGDSDEYREEFFNKLRREAPLKGFTFKD